MNFVNKANDLFQEKFAENGLLLCKMDKADVLEYEEMTGQNVLEAAKEMILFYSEDGTIESGLKVLEKKSKIKDAADYVGYLLITDIRKSD